MTVSAIDRATRKSHAITLRKQGWTERAIAGEVGLSKTAVHNYLVTAGVSGVCDRSARMVTYRERRPVTKNLEFQRFQGAIEDFSTDIRFPLIVADPPWNISAKLGDFTFKDKGGKHHTPMIREFGAWDFQGTDTQYLQNVSVWLQSLYNLAADNSWCWFWCSYRYLSHINNIGKSVGWEPRGWYVWAKTNCPPLLAGINGTLLPSLEPCLIFRKGSGQLRNGKTGHPNYKELPMVTISERLPDAENVAAKPQAILWDIIEWCTEPGDWVLDAFSGTGSTSRAALSKKRNAVAVEIDKRQLTLLELFIEETYGPTVCTASATTRP